jgi:predicted  nucleic acid-binding Zn-ribbon protein
MSELHDIDRRVAVLEQIAADTRDALQDIRADMRGLRTEMRTEFQGLRTEFQGLRTELHNDIRDLRGDFRWLLRFTIGGFVGVLALLAHGLHWF